MRSLFTYFAFLLSLAFAFAFPVAPAQYERRDALRVLEYSTISWLVTIYVHILRRLVDIESAYTKFTLPCPAKSCSGANDSLVSVYVCAKTVICQPCCHTIT